MTLVYLVCSMIPSAAMNGFKPIILPRGSYVQIISPDVWHAGLSMRGMLATIIATYDADLQTYKCQVTNLGNVKTGQYDLSLNLDLKKEEIQLLTPGEWTNDYLNCIPEILPEGSYVRIISKRERDIFWCVATIGEYDAVNQTYEQCRVKNVNGTGEDKYPVPLHKDQIQLCTFPAGYSSDIVPMAKRSLTFRMWFGPSQSAVWQIQPAVLQARLDSKGKRVEIIDTYHKSFGRCGIVQDYDQDKHQYCVRMSTVSLPESVTVRLVEAFNPEWIDLDDDNVVSSPIPDILKAAGVRSGQVILKIGERDVNEETEEVTMEELLSLDFPVEIIFGDPVLFEAKSDREEESLTLGLSPGSIKFVKDIVKPCVTPTPHDPVSRLFRSKTESPTHEKISHDGKLDTRKPQLTLAQSMQMERLMERLRGFTPEGIAAAEERVKAMADKAEEGRELMQEIQHNPGL